MLLNLIANVKDTNIITRTNVETHDRVQNEIRQLIEEKGIENITTDELDETDSQFIRMNISPGGCADLLAITYILYFVENY